MKRYALYLKDESGAYEFKGEKYRSEGQVCGEDKADAERQIIENGRDEGRVFILRHIATSRTR